MHRIGLRPTPDCPNRWADQLKHLLTTILALACVLALSGCYALMGAEHNYSAVKDLEPGMSLSKCIEELAAGGQVEVQWDLPIDIPDERDLAIEGPNVLAALTSAEAETGRHAVRAQKLSRLWGVMGFGEVYLFLDAQDDLVGYHLFHVN